MSDRTLRRVAIVGWLMTLGLSIGGLLVRVISEAPVLPNRFGMGDIAALAFIVNQLASATGSLLVLNRLPRHRVGWSLVGTGLFYALSIAASSVAFAAAADPRLGLDLARWSGWMAFIGSAAAGVALFSIVLFFPDGRPSSPAFARLARFEFPLSAIFIAGMATKPGPQWLLSSLDNPIGVGPDFLAAAGPSFYPIASVVGGAIIFVASVSVAARFRASRGTERQQLKWFLAAVTLAMGGFAVTLAVGFASGGAHSEWPLAMFGLASAGIPVAIGIAILRYRLYEIDRIISRTLGYAALTAALAIVYVAAFVGLQAILTPVTSGGSLVVAASTLVVFALFQPLRRRIQSAMDRRFNRPHYDAQRIVEVLAGRLRDELDLEYLGSEVQAVIGQTLAPATVGVWLRPGAATTFPRSRNESRTMEA